MKKLLLLALLPATVFAQSNPNTTSVDGYVRKDGTYVQPHTRTQPNTTTRDNYSTSGNYNPYTGQTGRRPIRQGD